MVNTDTVEAWLPFDGFYESLHDAFIGQEIDLDGDDNESGYDQYNFKILRDSYAKAWVENIAREIDVPEMKFERLVTPREYNFETDKILVSLPLETARTMLEEVYDELKGLVNRECCDRSGFTTYYARLNDTPQTSDRRLWPIEVSEWDAVQVGLLLQAWGEHLIDSEWRDEKFLDSWNLNGEIAVRCFPPPLNCTKRS